MLIIALISGQSWAQKREEQSKRLLIGVGIAGVAIVAVVITAGGYKLLKRLKKVDKKATTQTTSLPSKGKQIQQAEENKSKAQAQLVAAQQAAKPIMQKARAGGILQSQEAEQVHKYWLAKLNLEKAQELELIYKNRDKAGYETALPRSTQEDIEQRYHMREEWHVHRYEIVKNLSPLALPRMQYDAQFMQKMQTIIDSTPLADELLRYVHAGNLQEVIWQLDEAGFELAARRFEELLTKELQGGEIVAETEVEGVRVLVLKSGVAGIFKGDAYSKHGEIASYQIDKLIGTNAFPLTVLRDAGSLQLFIESLPQKQNYMSSPFTTDFNDKYLAYVNFMDFADAYKHIEGEYDKKVTTLHIFSMDSDSVHNKIYPLQGRITKIDGAQALNTEFALEDLLPYMQENPQSLSFAPEIIARLKRLDAQQIEAALRPHIHPYDDDLDEIVSTVQALQKAYLELAKQ